MPDGGQNEIEAIVNEVFISPVRSVLLVDDEYPTLDAMLSGFIEKNDVWSKTKATAKTNATRLEKILRYCRSSERNWMVDVHDGQNVTFAEESHFVSNLHQSDLLFLDYHLDGDGAEPEKCIKILEHLASSNHFNLVVLVTKEDPQSAFTHILPRFIQSKASTLLNLKKDNKIEEEMVKWGDANDQIEENLATSISLDAYLKLTAIPITQLKVLNPKVSPYISDFIALANTKPKGIDIGKDDLLAWSLAKAETKLGIGGSCHIEHSGLDADPYW